MIFHGKELNILSVLKLYIFFYHWAAFSGLENNGTVPKLLSRIVILIYLTLVLRLSTLNLSSHLARAFIVSGSRSQCLVYKFEIHWRMHARIAQLRSICWKQLRKLIRYWLKLVKKYILFCRRWSSRSNLAAYFYRNRGFSTYLLCLKIICCNHFVEL